MQQQLKRQGYDYKVINASVSGDTTRTGLSRIQPALKAQAPAIVIVELGANARTTFQRDRSQPGTDHPAL